MPRVLELTPPGAGGVSVLAVRGPGALARVRALVPHGSLRAEDPPRPVLARLAADGEDLDEALVCVRGAEDVELHVHGSVALVARLREVLDGDAEASPPPASVEDEARALLDDAPCEAAARILLDQAEGALRREVLAACAAPDAPARLTELAGRWRALRRCFEPATVVLAGPVNAGKSTLFNVLVGEGRALVGDEEGTTRDLVREPALLGAWPVTLIDTAGERELEERDSTGQLVVERTGQERARRARDAADLVLRLAAPPWREHEAPVDTPGAAPRIVTLHTQSDRAPERDGPDPRLPAVSALRDPEGTRRAVARAFEAALELPAEPWIPGRAVPFAARHAAELARLAELAAAGPDRAVLEAAARVWLDGA